MSRYKLTGLSPTKRLFLVSYLCVPGGKLLCPQERRIDIDLFRSHAWSTLRAMDLEGDLVVCSFPFGVGHTDLVVLKMHVGNDMQECQWRHIMSDINALKASFNQLSSNGNSVPLYILGTGLVQNVQRANLSQSLWIGTSSCSLVFDVIFQKVKFVNTKHLSVVQSMWHLRTT